MSRLAIVGGGRMGEALAATAINGGMRAADIVVVEPDPARAAVLRAAHGLRTSELADAVAGAEAVALVVKPQVAPAVLGALAGLLTDGQLIVSLVLGVRIETIERASGLSAAAVVRCCPNLPIALGSGFTTITPGNGVRPDQLKLVESLFSAGGPVVPVTEPQLDAVSVVSGSTPAWYCYLVEALTDAGVLLGLGHQLSALIAERALIGAGALLRDSDMSAAQVRAAVSSPGGATIAGVLVLEERAVRGAFMAAAAAGVERAREVAEAVSREGVLP
jgi:pyrroline-5-carboxylate reductase